MVKMFLDCSFVAPCLDKSRLDHTGVRESIIAELKYRTLHFLSAKKTCSLFTTDATWYHTRKKGILISYKS